MTIGALKALIENLQIRSYPGSRTWPLIKSAIDQLRPAPAPPPARQSVTLNFEVPPDGGA